MTRWARGGEANKKKPLPATPWIKLSKNKEVNSQQETIPTPSLSKHAVNKIKKKKKIKKSFTGLSTCDKSEDKDRPSGGIVSQLEEIDNTKIGKVKKISELRNEVEKFKKSCPDLDESTKMELAEIIKKDERRERRREKRKDERATKKLCFNCRQPGHDASDCPKAAGDMTQGTGICYKCGSTEHSVSSCRLKLSPGEYPYAKCYICGEVGHISKQCPDNPRGLYPKGGCCRLCGSVEHYKKDCPELQKRQGIREVTLSTMSRSHYSADEEVSLLAKPTVKKKGPKIVKF